MSESSISKEIDRLLHILANENFNSSGTKLNIIKWSSPIPFFGNLYNSSIATVGINPSNNEFIDSIGNELEKERRRFHSLNSLSLESWSKSKNTHIEKIEISLLNYFNNNPYNRWFKKLDFLLSETGSSYYFPYSNVCHLDLVPFATSLKWGSLNNETKQYLLKISMNSIGNIVKYSPLKILILNGQTVVNHISNISNIKLEKAHMSNWDLKRKNDSKIQGYAYTGKLTNIGEIPLGKEIAVLGFNHNIQSSFGITKKVHSEIKDWIKTSIIDEN